MKMIKRILNNKSAGSVPFKYFLKFLLKKELIKQLIKKNSNEYVSLINKCKKYLKIRKEKF